VISNELKSELKIWKNCIADNFLSFPIPKIDEEIPIFYVENYTDAAGGAFSEFDKNTPIDDVRGAAAITIIKNRICCCSTVKWSYKLICKYPHNSAMFELIGVIIPFLTHPKIFKNKYVKCNVDNISLVFAWLNKTIKSDGMLYKIFQILHIIEYAIPCKIFIEHSQRRSSWQTNLVDNLTRDSTTLSTDENLVKNAKKHMLRGPLKKWIENPDENFNVMSIIECMENLL